MALTLNMISILYVIPCIFSCGVINYDLIHVHNILSCLWQICLQWLFSMSIKYMSVFMSVCMYILYCESAFHINQQSILHKSSNMTPGAIFSYKLRYIVGFWLVEMAISTNQNPTIYRNLYENTAPDSDKWHDIVISYHIFRVVS